MGSLKLGNVWVFVQVIFGPPWPMNQLKKNPNIEASYQLCSCSPSLFQDGVRCGACDRDRAGTMISLYGQPYDPTTLKTVPPSEEAVMNRVRMHMQGDSSGQ